MTDPYLAWRVRLGERWSPGARFDTTAWWDLAVPPGVVPARPDQREERTLVTYAPGATVGFHFFADRAADRRGRGEAVIG